MTNEQDHACVAALVAALGELGDVGKGRTANAGSYSYSYASLADVFTAVRPKLAAHGLAVVQPVNTDLDAGVLTVSTTVLHTGGGSFDLGRFRWALGRDLQSTGSAVSYARRYALMSALGIAGADDDDDGATGAQRPTQAAPASSERSGRQRGPSQAQMRRLHAMFSEAQIVDRDDRLTFASAVVGRELASSKELDAADMSKVIDALADVIADQPTDHDEPGVDTTTGEITEGDT